MYSKVEDSEDIINRLKVSIKPDFFEVSSKDLLLVENSRINTYELSIKNNSHDTYIVFKNIEALKMNCGYMHMESPKDCDYILMNLDREELFFVELKQVSTSKNLNKPAIASQLCSGLKWFEHFIFCAKISGKVFSKWNVRFLLVEVSKYSKKSKNNFKQTEMYGSGTHYHHIKTNRIYSSELRNITNSGPFKKIKEKLA